VEGRPYVGTPKGPIPATPQGCSRCPGSLTLAVRIKPVTRHECAHLIYRCEAYGRHEWAIEGRGSEPNHWTASIRGLFLDETSSGLW
jgi:hypothetical protein